MVCGKRFPVIIASAIALYLVSSAATAAATPEQHAPLNTLTQQEAQQGWQLLFDGKTLSGWSLYQSKLLRAKRALTFWRDTPATGGWVVDAAGNLQRQAGGGDLKTDQTFANFELKLEWKIAESGNSGIFLRVNEAAGTFAFSSGFEMQVLDNAGHADGKSLLTSAGALYALYPVPSADYAKPAGQWNAVRIVADGPRIQFYLNGHKTVEAVIGSSDWKQRLDAAPNRISSNENFGRYPSGHIVLQDHGDHVWYRNIKLRQF